MSAYICDREHIIYMVQAAMARRIAGAGCTVNWCHGNPLEWHKLGPCDFDKAADVANMLLRENYRSVSHRYPHESSATLPGPIAGVAPFTRKDFAVVRWHSFEPAQVLKSCHCFEYQACETDDWETTEAHAFIAGLKGAACRSVAGYEKAEWGAPAPECKAICLSALATAKPKRKFGFDDLFDAAS